MPSRSPSRRSPTAGQRSTSSSIRGTAHPRRSRRAMRADQADPSVLGLVQTNLKGVCRMLMNVVAGERGKALIDDLRAMVGGTPSEIVWKALYADCLRVVHSAVMADGVIAVSYTHLRAHE